VGKRGREEEVAEGRRYGLVLVRVVLLKEELKEELKEALNEVRRLVLEAEPTDDPVVAITARRGCEGPLAAEFRGLA